MAPQGINRRFELKCQNSFFNFLIEQVHHESLVKKKLELADKLWSHGIRCFVCDIHLSVEDVIEIASDCGASFVAIILDSEGNAR